MKDNTTLIAFGAVALVLYAISRNSLAAAGGGVLSPIDQIRPYTVNSPRAPLNAAPLVTSLLGGLAGFAGSGAGAGSIYSPSQPSGLGGVYWNPNAVTQPGAVIQDPYSYAVDSNGNGYNPENSNTFFSA